jgi:hypothetical protein
MSVMIVGLLLLAQLATAQQAVIDHCRNAASDADRIVCLEAALLGMEIEAAPTDITQSQIDPPGQKVDPAPADSLGELPESTVVGIGANQVITRTQTQQERIDSLEQARGMSVASYGTVPFQRLLVTLENGQVWRQIKGDTQQVRVDLKRNQTVDIEESSLGGYKLRLNEMRRTIRVERVK